MFLRQYDDNFCDLCGKFHEPQPLGAKMHLFSPVFGTRSRASLEPWRRPFVALRHSADPAQVSPQEGWPSSFEGARLNVMTDPRESPSLAEHGAIPRDLPPPPPLTPGFRPEFDTEAFDTEAKVVPALLDADEPIALFLDFDGTLVEIADHPDGVIVPPDLPERIARLSQRLDGRFAIVTGRSLDALEAMLGPLDVAVAGSHGGEFRAAGTRDVVPLAQPLPPVVAQRLSDFARANGDLLVEPKPFSIAVHYRRRPEAMPALLACAAETGEAFGLKLKHGKQVIELSMPGSDKGSAVARFMQMAPFAGARPLFAGDDVTDEDAFAAVTRLGGAGILVGPMRRTLARWRLDGVPAVHDWLAGATPDHASHSNRENSPA